MLDTLHGFPFFSGYLSPLFISSPHLSLLPFSPSVLQPCELLSLNVINAPSRLSGWVYAVASAWNMLLHPWVSLNPTYLSDLSSTRKSSLFPYTYISHPFMSSYTICANTFCLIPSLHSTVNCYLSLKYILKQYINYKIFQYEKSITLLCVCVCFFIMSCMLTSLSHWELGTRLTVLYTLIDKCHCTPWECSPPMSTYSMILKWVCLAICVVSSARAFLPAMYALHPGEQFWL